MPRILVGTMAMLALVACKGEVHQAARVIEGPGLEPIRIEAKSIDDTSIAFATRSVGLDFKRGAVLSMRVGGRPMVVLQRLRDAERAPSEKEVDALVAGVKTKRSADGQHLLVSWNLGRQRMELFHLLPKGGLPFQLAEPAPAPDMDLDALPPAETLAREALTEAARSPDCAIPGAYLFWEALPDGAGGTKLELPLLSLWPTCSQTWIPVNNLARNGRDLSPEWKRGLAAKRKAIIEAGGPMTHLRLVLQQCMFLDDDACAEAAAAKLAPAWPADSGVHHLVMSSFDDLPQSMRDAVLAKALGMKKIPSFEIGARVTRFMRKWASCEQYRRYAQAHLNVPQKRSDCPGWPLERFPGEGAAQTELQTLLTASDRPGAIRHVRHATGWEYAKAAKFVDEKLQSGPAPGGNPE